MNLIKECFGKAFIFFVFFAVLTGGIYTAGMTGVAQIFFPFQANGSVLEVEHNGETKKFSMLLGQTYNDEKYMWGRIQSMDFAIPSQSDFYKNSTAGENFFGDGVNSNWVPHSHGKDEVLAYSWASNRSPAGDAEGEQFGTRDEEELMKQQVADHVARIKAAHPEMEGTPIPVTLVTNSGSGLDPHISPAAAEYQVKRLARTRNMSEDEVRSIIKKATTGRTFGVFGEPVVHVLKVNLMLDGVPYEKLKK